jgi:hypothetical protein
LALLSRVFDRLIPSRGRAVSSFQPDPLLAILGMEKLNIHPLGLS